MLDFAIVALPRSGTTWAANWLTHRATICLHDPVATRTLDELAEWGKQGAGFRGFACTATWAFPEWLHENVRRVIVLERPIDEIQASLKEIGLPPLTEKAIEEFRSINVGMRINHTNLFHPTAAKEIFDYLIPIGGFDAERHAILREMHITPRFESMEFRREACLDMIRRLSGIMTQTQSEPPSRP